MKTPKEINDINKEFWDKETTFVNELSLNTSDAKELFRRLDVAAQYEFLANAGKAPIDVLNACIKADSFAPKRQKGAIGNKQEHINILVKNNPNLPAKTLRKLADESILDGMKESTFANNVTKARTAK